MCVVKLRCHMTCHTSECDLSTEEQTSITVATDIRWWLHTAVGVVQADTLDMQQDSLSDTEREPETSGGTDNCDPATTRIRPDSNDRVPGSGTQRNSLPVPPLPETETVGSGTYVSWI